MTRGSPSIVAPSPSGFPKSARILRSKDFRRVYDNGSRFSCALFSAFCLREPGNPEAPSGPRIGFTTPRGLGKATVRNRIRRRVREAVRKRMDKLGAEWSIVINPRRKALECPFPEIEREIDRLFLRCGS